MHPFQLLFAWAALLFCGERAARTGTLSMSPPPPGINAMPSTNCILWGRRATALD